MAATRAIKIRVSAKLERRARARAPELLDDLDRSMLARVGLAMLAGDDLQTALQAARDDRSRPGPPPKQKAA